MSDETYTANLESCNPSDCASCTANCSSAGGQNQGTIPNVPNPTIKLTLDDDSVLECAVLTTFPVEEFGEYIALVPKMGKILQAKPICSAMQKKMITRLSPILNGKMSTWQQQKPSMTSSQT